MTATGVETKAAVKRGLSWGTAVPCGAGDGLLILPPTLKKEKPFSPDDSLGAYYPGHGSYGEVKVEGDLPAWLRYDGLDLLLALAMGGTLGAPQRQGLTSAYAQGLRLADSLDGLFATFAVNNGVNVDEYPSVKITGFTIKGEVGRPVRVAFHAIANDRLTGSAVNTPASFAAVTFFETANRVLFAHGAFMLNGRDDAALSEDDRIYPSQFEFTFKRNMRGAYAAGQAETIDEPANDGAPEVGLKVEFPRYSSAAYFGDWDDGAPKKLEMLFMGAEIEAPHKRSLRISFPHLVLSGVDLPVEKGILRHPLEFACLAAASAPAGMEGLTAPFAVDLVNRQSADVLG